MRRRSCTASSASLRIPSGARSHGPRRNSLRSLRSLRSNSLGESDERSARCARAATSPALLSAAQCRCRRTPTHGFARYTDVFIDEYLGSAARWAVSDGGDLWGGEKRSDARGSPGPQEPDRREAMKQWRVQRRCERHRSRPCDASTTAKSARSADRHSMSPHRVPPAAPRRTRRNGN